MTDTPVPSKPVPSGNVVPRNVHATVVAIGLEGLLIRGASRSGKSALAFSLLRRAETLRLDAALVADDQVFLELDGKGSVFAVAPAPIRGLIEVSGIGVLPERFVDRARLTLVVDLREAADIERLPDVAEVEIAGVMLRRIVLPARQASFGADILQGLVMRPTIS